MSLSRRLRSPVEAGSIPYSAVTQPLPLPAIHFGTFASTEAVQITRVPPTAISADPSAVPTQIKFLDQELQTRYPDIYKRVHGAQDPGAAASAMISAGKTR